MVGVFVARQKIIVAPGYREHMAVFGDAQCAIECFAQQRFAVAHAHERFWIRAARHRPQTRAGAAGKDHGYEHFVVSCRHPAGRALVLSARQFSRGPMRARRALRQDPLPRPVIVARMRLRACRSRAPNTPDGERASDSPRSQSEPGAARVRSVRAPSRRTGSRRQNRTSCTVRARPHDRCRRNPLRAVTPRSSQTCISRRGRLCDETRRCRRADLIADDAELVALRAKPQHRAQKIVAARRVHPCRAQQQMSCTACAQRLFSGEFRTAVDSERRRRSSSRYGRVAVPSNT